MFYKTCLALAITILTFSIIGASSNASSLTLRQQNYVDNRAQRRIRSVYIVPNPFYTRGVYTGGSGVGRSSGSSGSSGSGRSSYDGYRGGGPGSGK